METSDHTVSLDARLESVLRDAGAALVGYADISSLPVEQNEGFPIGVAVATLHQKDVIRGIYDAPTRDYLDWYNLLNSRLDAIVTTGAQFLIDNGYRALARTRAYAKYTPQALATTLPHKTVARLAGLGWIGKTALLVTPQYGSMIRLSVLLTDAPLTPGTPIDEPRCYKCMRCVDECPGHAASGNNWKLGCERSDFFDAFACERYAREICMKVFNDNPTICGKCILVCPWTQRYLREDG